MMNKITIFLLVAIAMVACKKGKTLTSVDNSIVTLKGTIANYEQDTLFMTNYTAKNTWFKEDIHAIPLKGKKNFNYKFELKEPAYFRLGRTFLYLSPGDSLVADIDTQTRTTGKFTGKGAEANTYLTQLPYPKGGSYWGEKEVSSSIKTYKDMPSAFKDIVYKRLTELNSLKNVSEEFKRIESARVEFDYVNSLQSLTYLYYRKLRQGEITQQKIDSLTKVAQDFFTPQIKESLKNFNSTDYLQLESFQSVLYSLKKDEFRKKYGLPDLNDELKEYLKAGELIDGFRTNGYTSAFINSLNKEIKNIKNTNYISAIELEKKEYEAVVKGQPAADITMSKLDGTTVKLSDYKGKIIVVDLWATWCGPCMQEKPFFDSLEEKMHNENVAFISLSIDKKEVWENYFKKNKAVGNQLQIYRSELSDYKIVGIPRFFVIDQDFNIVDVFAPLPSTGELEKLIREYL